MIVGICHSGNEVFKIDGRNVATILFILILKFTNISLAKSKPALTGEVLNIIQR